MSDDRDWDAELEAAAAVRRRYRDVAASDEPPAALDDAILAASRRAVSAGPVPLGASRWRSWRMPLAAAAVIVLSASVGLLMWDDKVHEQWSSEEHGPVSSGALPDPADVSPKAGMPDVSAEMALPQAPSASADSAGRAPSRQEAGTPRNLLRSEVEEAAALGAASKKAVTMPESARSVADASAQSAPVPSPVVPAAPAPPLASAPGTAYELVARTLEADRQEKPAEATANAETPVSAAKSAPRRSEADAMESREFFAGGERAGRLRGSAPGAVAPAAAPRVGRNDDGVEELRVIGLLWEAGRQADAVEALRRLRCRKPYVPIPPDYPVSLTAPLVCPQAAKEPSAPDR